MDLAKRSLFSITWNFLANLAVYGVAFIRAILLARLLPVEVFGIYAGYNALLTVTVTLTEFGMVSAFIHKAPETEDEDKAAAMHFTLRIVFLSGWTLVACVAAVLFLTGAQQAYFLWMIFATILIQLAWPARAVLMKRVDHRRSAIIAVLFTLVHAVTAVYLAWSGWGVYSIIFAELLGALVTLSGYYLFRPAWKPRLAWYPEIFRYYLDFGKRAFASTFLYHLLDHVDDLWTRFRLGEIPMGFYSKAYRFAIYPRLILATPITHVIGGTYAELKDTRKELSQAFFRTNALLIRSGFFLAGWMAVVAPEFISILLTDKWMPMLDAFRLMLIFTLLDPLKLSISEVLNAVGKPEKVVFTRSVQLLVLMIGLVYFSPRWGIAGVALAVDIMLLVGIAILLWQSKEFVDFSIKQLFLAPGGALVVGILLAQAAMQALPGHTDLWLIGLFKTLAFFTGYLVILLSLERDRLTWMLNQIFRILKGSSTFDET